jgi:hypothetical protein
VSSDEPLPWPADVDFAPLRERLVGAVDTASTRSERRMAAFPKRHPDYHEHLKLLRHEFVGKSELLFVHAALVVALRRGRALHVAVPLFRRLWAEQGAFLRRELSLRWLVSATDSFADHGADHAERTVALLGTVLVNSVKLHETERALLGQRGTAAGYPEKPPSPKLFDGLTRFSIAKGDLVENMVARIRAVAEAAPLVAPLIEEMIARLLANDTVYRRFAEERMRLASAEPGPWRPRPLLGWPRRGG